MSNTAKWILGVAIVLLVIIGVVAFGSDTNQTSQNKEPIKIGGTFALSDTLAFLGKNERNGWKMAIDEINEDGGVNGRDLVLVAEDNQGKAKQAANSVSKLLNVDDVDIVFSAFTHITKAVKDVVTEAETPLLYHASLPDIAESSEYAFRDYFDNVDNGKKMAEHANNEGYESVAILGENNESCKQMMTAVKENINADLTNEEYFNPDTSDFSTVLTKIRSNNPEAMVLCSFRHNQIIMPEMDQLEMLDIPTIQFAPQFLPVADTSEMRELYAENNTVGTWYGFAKGSPDQLAQEFINKYEKRFGSKPSPDAGFAYDDAYVVADALDGCADKSEIDNQCFIENMLKTDHQGVAGPLSFDDQGLSNRDVLLIEVVNGEWQELSASQSQ